MFNDSSFGFSNAAWIILAANGSLSAASSILIMSIIIRSAPEARSSAYHIIMFFMSFWDIILSLAFALNTIPMPSDVYEIYPFAGKALGTTETCVLQGFLITMGTSFVLLSNTTLNLYYLSTIRYAMSEEKFKRCIMPVMLVLAMAISIMMPTIDLKKEMINPSPLGSICTVTSYPYGCSGIDCIRGNPALFQKESMLWSSLFGSIFAIMVISLVLVVLSVFDTELAIRRSTRINRSSRLINRRSTGRRARRLHEQEIRKFKITRAVLNQALMYISAFLLSYSWIFLIGFLTSKHRNTLEFGSGTTLSVFAVFFQPLQGFFNAMIFIYQKARILRRMQTHAGLNWLSAFKKVILEPSVVPEQLISCIDIATEDISERRPQGHNSRMSLRERAMINGSGLRRFGSSNDVNKVDANAAPPPSISSSGGFDGSFLNESSDILLQDMLGPDDEDDEDKYMNLSTKDDAEIVSSPFPDQEDQSSMSMASSIMNNSVTWSSILSTVIPEDDNKTSDQRIDPHVQGA